MNPLRGAVRWSRDYWPFGAEIDTWRKFKHRIRHSQSQLLSCLDQFTNPILVAGCQRSGTTALTRIIKTSPEVNDYQFGKDDELDAALILSGHLKVYTSGRYCFQTTYLNSNYFEYLTSPVDFKLVWVTRNPHSVVYSMLNNWGTFALNELYEECGARYFEHNKLLLEHVVDNVEKLSKLEKACLAYNGKSSQMLEITDTFPQNRLILVDYDQLVSKPDKSLKKIFAFLELDYQPHVSNYLRSESLEKANKFSNTDIRKIEKLCMEVYENNLKYQVAR